MGLLWLEELEVSKDVDTVFDKRVGARLEKEHT